MTSKKLEPAELATKPKLLAYQSKTHILIFKSVDIGAHLAILGAFCLHYVFSIKKRNRSSHGSRKIRSPASVLLEIRRNQRLHTCKHGTQGQFTFQGIFTSALLLLSYACIGFDRLSRDSLRICTRPQFLALQVRMRLQIECDALCFMIPTEAL